MKKFSNCFAYALPRHKYHLNGLNEANQAATPAIHMCLVAYVSKVRAFSLHDITPLLFIVWSPNSEYSRI